MSNDKPRTVQEYWKWMMKSHGCQSKERTTTYYESVTHKLKVDLEKSAYWIELLKQLREFNDQYLLRTGYPLLMMPGEPRLDIKPFNSFLDKTYRKNVLQNKIWPDAPHGGWLLPNDWFSKINDTIRTLLVVKYLDGVLFLVEKLKAFSAEHNVDCLEYLEAREEGYYAAHVYPRQSVEIPRIGWDTDIVKVTLEIQITTQLQETIRVLLHKYYVERRGQISSADIKWQWDYKSNEFATNYLGHILHYVEGMILDIRDRTK